MREDSCDGDRAGQRGSGDRSKMHDFCFTIPYGPAVLAGGVVGYARRSNKASLAGGLGDGLFLLHAGFLVFPFVWSIPKALTTAELATTLPGNGGYVLWDNRAFGPLAGTPRGMAIAAFTLLFLFPFDDSKAESLREDVLPHHHARQMFDVQSIPPLYV